MLNYPHRFLLLLFLSAIVTSSQANEPQLHIQRTDKAPAIDGMLDDEAWKDATLVTEFYQLDPVAGANPSEVTEAYLAYDNDILYVGARLFDRNPEAIVAREMLEDGQMLNDDVFTIAIDSMLDRKNAFVFTINALGTKAEARVENNSTMRMEWDGVWYGAASRDERG